MALTRRRTVTLLASLATPFVHRGATAATAIRAAAERLPQLHSIQVLRGAELVVAERVRGPALAYRVNIKSCSKSVVTLLLGASIQRGEIASIDATLGEVAPRLIPADATPGVAGITMGDLATLRAGLAGTSGPNYGRWVGSRDWVAYVLRQPMLDRPGGRMIYSTGTTHVLGAALAEASGRNLRTLARERLGRPLGIDIPAWTRDPQGFYLGGNEMALTPAAMLRLAVMVRDGGRFDGRQVLPANWIRESLLPRTLSPFSGLGYGYGWFTSESGFALARGYGGQLIAAHPERGLAVAITSDITRPARSEGYFGALMALMDGPVLALA